MHDDVLDMSAGALATAIGRRQLSAREVVQAMLAQIEAYNPTLNAICTLNEHVLADAEAIDRRLAVGESAHSLEGVPSTGLLSLPWS